MRFPTALTLARESARVCVTAGPRENSTKPRYLARLHFAAYPPSSLAETLTQQHSNRVLFKHRPQGKRTCVSKEVAMKALVFVFVGVTGGPELWLASADHDQARRRASMVDSSTRAGTFDTDCKKKRVWFGWWIVLFLWLSAHEGSEIKLLFLASVCLLSQCCAFRFRAEDREPQQQQSRGGRDDISWTHIYPVSRALSLFLSLKKSPTSDTAVKQKSLTFALNLHLSRRSSAERRPAS